MKVKIIAGLMLISNMAFASDFSELKMAFSKMYNDKEISFKVEIFTFVNESDSGTLINSSVKQRKKGNSYMNFFSTEYFLSKNELIVVNNKRKEISYQEINGQKGIPSVFEVDSSFLKHSDSIIEISRNGSLVRYSVFSEYSPEFSYTEILVDVERNEIIEMISYYSNSADTNSGSLNRLQLKYTYEVNDDIPKKALKKKRYVSGSKKKMKVSKNYVDYKLISVS